MIVSYVIDETNLCSEVCDGLIFQAGSYISTGHDVSSTKLMD